jgi:hypothetical protein
MIPFNILESGFDRKIAKAIINAYSEIEHNYVLRKWKPSELDAGHFVEAVRRALDLELTGTYIAFTCTLPPFDDNCLRQYEQRTGNQSYRILIPRVLKSIYNIRNRRGVAHISNINPNEMDATLILYTVKWILAELLRLKSGLSTEKTQKMLESIVERHCPLVWKEGNIESIMDPKMKAREQILVLLYKNSPRMDAEMQQIAEYSNSTNFRNILKKLHKNKFIYYQKYKNCYLTPRGVNIAEEIIQRYTSAE